MFEVTQDAFGSKRLEFDFAIIIPLPPSRLVARELYRKLPSRLGTTVGSPKAIIGNTVGGKLTAVMLKSGMSLPFKTERPPSIDTVNPERDAGEPEEAQSGEKT